MSQLASLGGKGVNLVRLREAGFDVPKFVVVPTGEYNSFVAEAGLAPIIEAALHGVQQHTAEMASNTIRAAFAASTPSDAQRARLIELVSPVADSPMAVRSSATAEDSPSTSFAGQQDSYLNVASGDVVDRIVDCWSSLWTTRALVYRIHRRLGFSDLALAVVVQTMVDADASGVMFTANPLSGKRGQIVIEGVRGLGEKLVSGVAMPDRFVIEGGEFVSAHVGEQRSLSDHQATLLAELGARIEARFAAPQDVEWVRVADRLRVVQTRPITSLFPVPEFDRDGRSGQRGSAGGADQKEELGVWFSLGAFQGVLEPFTPLGRDLLVAMGAGGARLGGVEMDRHHYPYLGVAAERLWVRVDSLMRSPGVSSLLVKAMPLIDPASAAIMGELAEDPRLAPRSRVPKVESAARMARTASWYLPAFPGAIRHPQHARERMDAVANELVDSVVDRLAAADEIFDPRARLAARVKVIEAWARQAFSVLVPTFAPIMGPGNMMILKLRELARRTGLPDADSLALTALQALSGNVTTQMNFALADVAAQIRQDAPSYGWVVTTPPAELAAQFRDRGLPRVALEAMASFLDTYGARGTFEIDIGGQRWRDDTTAVWDAVASYLAIDDLSLWPAALHARGVSQAEAAIDRLAAASGVRGREVRWIAKTVRELFGARETPKFAIARSLGLMREALQASARDMVAIGALAHVDDIFFLTLDELPRAFVGGWGPLIAHRRATYEWESQRVRIPRVLVSDGRAFYENPLVGDGLHGDGVSPGIAEGVVRVVSDPAKAQLASGEILVCRGTSPAWTPLFGVAGGLITEVGGLMTHGAVVAREYGLPAVVGVFEATTRLSDGQRVRMDGTSGAVTLL